MMVKLCIVYSLIVISTVVVSDYILIENNQLYSNFIHSLEFDMTKGPIDFVFLIAVQIRFSLFC